jgi:hypothetical protein
MVVFTKSMLNVAIIGGGAFGTNIALNLCKKDVNVTLFDRAADILSGASFNNQNRLHLGFHYPRDIDTAIQCIKGFERFKNEFNECVIGDFNNAYFLANTSSKTTPAEYLSFCDRLNLKYEVLDLGLFSPTLQNVSLGIKTGEVVYDCKILRELFRKRLERSNVKLKLNVDITRIERTSNGYSIGSSDEVFGAYDVMINSTYSNISRLNSQLNIKTPDRQYEYTMIPIIEWDKEPLGITIMDGSFMTVLPFGNTGKFLLYHVDHSVVETKIDAHLPLAWLNKSSSPSNYIDAKVLFHTLKESCIKFIPDLISASLVGFLQGPRMVLAEKNNTDARPSIINQHEKNYFSVFSGKIDHCIWVADEIKNLIL